MPDLSFMIMGNNYNTIRIHQMYFLGNATDLFSFYGDISLLLVPSIIAGDIQEYNRSAFNGIPTLAQSNRGVTEGLEIADNDQNRNA